MSATSGFYIPQNLAKSFVLNQYKEDGTPKYNIDSSGNIYSPEAAMNAQRAIQSLNSSYSDTINNAYSQYLNSKRGIMASDMGEGFKQAYLQQQEQALRDHQVQTAMTASEARQTILGEVAEANAAVAKNYEQEVGNINTLAANVDRYRTYVNSLVHKDDSKLSFLSDYEKTLSTEHLYDILLNMQPGDYIDNKSAAGLSFMDWMKNQVSTDSDQQWFNWLTTGGYEQFKQGVLDSYGDKINLVKTVSDIEDKIAQKASSIPTFDTYASVYKPSAALSATYEDKTIAAVTKDFTKYAADLNLTNKDIENALGSDLKTYFENNKFIAAMDGGTHYNDSQMSSQDDVDELMQKTAKLLNEYALKKAKGEV